MESFVTDIILCQLIINANPIGIKTMQKVKRFFAVAGLALAISAPLAMNPAHAMTLHDAVKILFEFGQQDIDIVKKISPDLAKELQKGKDATYKWCDANDTQRSVCIAAAVAIIIAEA